MLRFLKILTPVKCVIPVYDGYIVPPKEGELHRRSRNGIVRLKPPPAWSADIDKVVLMQGLRLLWDSWLIWTSDVQQYHFVCALLDSNVDRA